MKKTIYLAGAMTGLNIEDQTLWRNDVKSQVEMITDKQWLAINPVDHFTLDCDEREGMEYDLLRVRNCDLVICDFDHPTSIGTTWELAVASELNIPILGICEKKNLDKIHPWWKLKALHIFTDVDELIDYFLINFARGD